LIEVINAGFLHYNSKLLHAYIAHAYQIRTGETWRRRVRVRAWFDVALVL
jgi:hypothetical protein